jgi:hypothetical protein
MPQLGNCDRGHLKSVVGTGSHPVLEVEGAFLAPNDDVRVENYPHRLDGALSLLRAVRRSRRHALASVSGKPVLESASAKSRPAHTFSLAGTRRANGSASPPGLKRQKFEVTGSRVLGREEVLVAERNRTLKAEGCSAVSSSPGDFAMSGFSVRLPKRSSRDRVRAV